MPDELEILLNPLYCLLVQEHAFCFLHLLLNLTHTNSPLPTSTGRAATPLLPMPAPYRCAAVLSLLVGILSDLTEIGSSFRLLRVARRPGEGVIAGRAQASRRRSWPLPSRAIILGRRLTGIGRSPALCCVERKKKGKNRIFQEYISSISDVSEVCCKCRISMLQK
jgi:hypothetical protein